jgi:hypothetical protein
MLVVLAWRSPLGRVMVPLRATTGLGKDKLEAMEILLGRAWS